MYRTLLRWSQRIEQNKVITSIRKSLIMLTPVLIIGSFALFLQSFPLLAYQAWLPDALSTIFSIIHQCTLGFVAIYLLCGISYFYAGELETDAVGMRVMSIFTALSCFLALFGGVDDGLDFSVFGANGVFTGMICAIAATKLFYFLNKQFRKKRFWYTAGADLYFRNAMRGSLPFAATIIVFLSVHLLLRFGFNVCNLNELIMQAMSAMLTNMHTELGSGFLYTVLLNLLWFFGIHGGNVLSQSAAAVFTGTNGPILTKTFTDHFVMLGGCGATLALVIAILLFSKTKNLRQLACTASPFALLNMNELLVFGLPTVLNPCLFLPFLLAPVASLLISYTASCVGFLPPVTQSLQWTTPVLFSGYMATGSLHGTVVQLVSLLVCTLIYAPFVHLSEQMQSQQENSLLEKLTEIVKTHEENGEPILLLERHDQIGALAKKLAVQLRTDIESEQIDLHYQPQVGVDGGVSGAEALLRWRFNGQLVYPPLAVAVAMEDESFEQLTWLIIRIAARDARTVMSIGALKKCAISVNIAAWQLSNPAFINRVISLVQSYGLCGYFCLEVTENTAIDHMERILENAGRLRDNGIFISIDDFSMGHTSIAYLQADCFRYVKLDGGLVRQMSENPRCGEIISSITELGGRLDFEVVAEYVETKELQQELRGLGCHYFQGYYYSPALPLGEFVSYCAKNNAEVNRKERER